MKHAELRSIVHNVADSLGSGIGLMIGHYEMDVYGDAERSRERAITVDFLHGVVIVNGGQIPGHRGGVKAGHCDAGLTI